MACPYRDKILQAFWPEGLTSAYSVWAILDGARDDRIYSLLRDSGLDYLCLYSGYLPLELKWVAPYMIELSPTGLFTRRLLDLAWGDSWGVFASTQDGPNLRNHLRKFLRVRNEQGKMLLFRYYDPRVLRVYLPTCLPDELKTVFGLINRYFVEDKNSQVLIEFKLNGLRLEQRRILLQGEDGY